MEHVALFTLGLVLLAAGAPLLVFGAARLDRATGRGPFAVGIVAVAFGPCVAGLAFDLSVVTRHPPLPRPAVGHLIGHNIASLGLVLGVAALVRPIAATAKLFYTAIPLALGATALCWFLARNGPKLPVSRVDAGFLLAAFAVAMVLLIRAAMRETAEVKAEFASWLPERLPPLLAGSFSLAGLAGIVAGAYLTAAHVAGTGVYLRASTLIVADTLGAFVTSLPTLIAAVIASRRGRSDLVLGLVVGSMLVNLLLVAGIAAMVEPLQIDQWVILGLDPAVNPWLTLGVIPALGLFTLLLIPPLANGLRVPRWQGLLLLAGYAGFIAWQVSVARAVAKAVTG